MLRTTSVVSRQHARRGVMAGFLVLTLVFLVALPAWSASEEKDQKELGTGNDILTYAKSSGVYAGVSLEGATIEPDDDANKRLYGKDVVQPISCAKNGVQTTQARRGNGEQFRLLEPKGWHPQCWPRPRVLFLFLGWNGSEVPLRSFLIALAW